MLYCIPMAPIAAQVVIVGNISRNDAIATSARNRISLPDNTPKHAASI
jgi:hypothetical protein